MGRNIIHIFFAAVLLVAITSLFGVKAQAITVDVKNIQSAVENIINNTANSGNNNISGETVIGGEIKTGDANAQSAVTNMVNTTVVDCCGTPTPTPSVSPTPTSPPTGGGGDGGGGNSGGGGGVGGGEVGGAAAPAPQGEVLGLSTTSGEAPLGALQSLGLVWLGIGLKLLTKKLA